MNAYEVGIDLKLSTRSPLEPLLREIQEAQGQLRHLKEQLGGLPAVRSPNHAGIGGFSAPPSVKAMRQAARTAWSSADQGSVDRTVRELEEVLGHRRAMVPITVQRGSVSNGVVTDRSNLSGRDDPLLLGRLQAAGADKKQFASAETLAELEQLKKRIAGAATEVAPAGVEAAKGLKQWGARVKEAIGPLNALRGAVTNVVGNIGFVVGTVYTVYEGLSWLSKQLDSAAKATARYEAAVGTLAEQDQRVTRAQSSTRSFRERMGVIQPLNDAEAKLRELRGPTLADIERDTGARMQVQRWSDNPRFNEAIAVFMGRMGAKSALGSRGRLSGLEGDITIHKERLASLKGQLAHVDSVRPGADEQTLALYGGRHRESLLEGIAVAKAGLINSENELALARSEERAAESFLFRERLRPSIEGVASQLGNFKNALSQAGQSALGFLKDASFGFSELPILKDLGKTRHDITAALERPGGARELALTAIGEQRAKAQVTGKREDRLAAQALVARYEGILTWADRASLKVDARGARVNIQQRIDTENPAMLARESLTASFEAIARNPIRARARQGSVHLANGD